MAELMLIARIGERETDEDGVTVWKGGFKSEAAHVTAAEINEHAIDEGLSRMKHRIMQRLMMENIHDRQHIGNSIRTLIERWEGESPYNMDGHIPVAKVEEIINMVCGPTEDRDGE